MERTLILVTFVQEWADIITGSAALKLSPNKYCCLVSVPQCAVEKGYVVDEAGNCVCPPGTGLNANDECVRCLQERGQRIDDRGRCVCALERGMIIDERGNCVCPTEFGYKLDVNGHCVPCKLLYLLFEKLRMQKTNWFQYK